MKVFNLFNNKHEATSVPAVETTANKNMVTSNEDVQKINRNLTPETNVSPIESGSENNPEIVEALAEVEATYKEIASIDQATIDKALQSPEKRQSLGSKLDLLAKLSDKFKSVVAKNADAVVASVATLSSLAYALINNPNWDSNTIQSGEIATVIAGAGVALSTILWMKNRSEQRQAEAESVQA
jgi:hypothetical protein